MLQCRDIEELMVDFLYQELDEPQAKAFEEHLHGCARCEAELASLARTRQALRGMPLAEPSPAVSARLLHEAARRAPKGDEERGGVLAWLKDFFAPLARQPAWVGAAASVLLVAGLASVLTLRKEAAVRATAEVATKAEPAAPALAPKADSEASGGEKAREVGRETDALGHAERRYQADTPVVAAAPPPALAAKPHDGLAEKSAVKTKSAPMKKAAPSPLSSDDESRAADFAGAKLESDRTGRTTTPREEGAVRAATSDKNAAPSGYRQAEDQRKDAVQGKGGDLDRASSNELRLADSAKAGKADQAPAPTDRPSSPQAQEGQKAPETRDTKEAPLMKNGTLGGSAGPTSDRRAGGAPAGNAEAPAAAAPAPTKAPQRLNSEVQQSPSPSTAAPERERNNRNEKQATPAPEPKQVEQKPAPAKPSPPSQSAELHQQARKQASSGACPEAMALRDKISRIDPGYFNKNVAGDPAFRGCMDQQRAKAKRAAPAEAAPRNDNLDAAEKNDTKAAH